MLCALHGVIENGIKDSPDIVQKNFYCNKKTRAAISETAASLGITESVLIESAILQFFRTPRDQQYELVAEYYRWLGGALSQPSADNSPPAMPPSQPSASILLDLQNLCSPICTPYFHTPAPLSGSTKKCARIRGIHVSPR